ncbi:MAG TPA: rod shape-determining protein RodA [Bacteroidales bacterium]|nr:rod shape-determining protein RodA [Bacteroidales bacterium]HSA44631.1 rod shape-determining protein RodA [Bacteroidales bacterium]
MVREERNIFKNIDWITVGIYLLLVLFGWMNIYAAVFNEQHDSIFDLSQRYGKQMIWILVSILLALIILMTEPKVFNAFAFFIYGLSILSLFLVLFIGKEVSGSKSWIDLGGFDLQPSEFAKIAVNLAIARHLSSLNIRMEDLRTRITTFFLIGLPVILILLQDDTGSALVFTAFIIVLYREGLSGNVLIIGGLVIILFILALMVDKWIIIAFLALIALIWFSQIRKNRRDIVSLLGLFLLVAGFVYSVDFAFHHVLDVHHKERINVLIGKEVDLKGAGYNVNQSKIAIGSGRIIGKGFLQGTQTKYNFVPEQSTDFIFCTIGEEWGFIGSVLTIALFIILFIRILNIAERQRSAFSRIYGYGVASVFFFHFLVNIGMTIGLAPVIGIPLPFISYGGSSLFAFTIMLFIFIRMDANRLQLL